MLDLVDLTLIHMTLDISPGKVRVYGKRPVVWAAPSYANRCVFARNDEEVLCASLAADP